MSLKKLAELRDMFNLVPFSFVPSGPVDNVVEAIDWFGYPRALGFSWIFEMSAVGSGSIDSWAKCWIKPPFSTLEKREDFPRIGALGETAYWEGFFTVALLLRAGFF